MKHPMSWILSLGLLAIACGDDGATGDGGSGSGSGTEGTTGGTTMPATTAPATTEPMTSGMTTVGPDDTSTTAPADSSGGSSEGTTNSSTGPAEGSSSSGAPPMDPAYPPCTPDADPVCPDPYDHCYSGLMPGAGHSVCSVMCMDDAECPLPDSGDAVAACAGPMGNECVLDCGGGATCPDGMDCVEIVMGIERCAWPD